MKSFPIQHENKFKLINLGFDLYKHIKTIFKFFNFDQDY